MIGEKLKEIREQTGLNKKDFANYIGMKYTTYNNYETGDREPSSDFLIMISQKFDVSIDYILGLQNEKEIKHSYELKSSEYDHIKKYRSLDPHGQETVSYILDQEAKRVVSLHEQAERIKKLESQPAAIIGIENRTQDRERFIEYYRSVSAGTGQVIFDDVYSERIPLPDIPKYRKVAYAVKVNGNSMEPLYNDGDILLIEPTCEIAVKEIGIFNVNGQAYVKRLGEGKLISLNKGYGDIPLTEDSLCMGRVVDKLQLSI